MLFFFTLLTCGVCNNLLLTFFFSNTLSKIDRLLWSEEILKIKILILLQFLQQNFLTLISNYFKDIQPKYNTFNKNTLSTYTLLCLDILINFIFFADSLQRKNTLPAHSSSMQLTFIHKKCIIFSLPLSYSFHDCKIIKRI